MRLSVRDLTGVLSLALAVCALALVWSVAERSRESIRQLSQAIPGDTLIVRNNTSSTPESREAFERSGGQVGLLADEINGLRQIEGVTGVAWRGGQFFVVGENYRIVQQVTSANFPEVLGLSLASGRRVTDQEEEFGLPFTVIGQITAQEYFGDGDPIGQTIATGLGTFRVVGVLDTIDPDLTELKGLDAGILVPASADPGGASRRGFANTTVFVSHAPGQGPQVTRALQERLAATPVGPLYAVQTPEQWLGAPQVFRREVAQGLTQAVGWTVLLALIAAGANLANLFTLRVLLRRRELAVRRALGATRTQVLLDVMGDLALLGVYGALLGGALAATLGWLAPTAFPPPTPGVLLLSVLAGLGITALAAIWPTRVAVRTPPSVGLRDIPMTVGREGIGLTGLVFGVATLLASLAVSDGSERWVAGRINELGGQRVVFTTITGPFDEIRTIRPKPPVNTADFEALSGPEIARKAMVGIQSGDWKYPGVDGNRGIVSMAFARGDYFEFAARPLVSGRYPERPNEAVIGADGLSDAFPGQTEAQVVGQTLTLERRQGSGDPTKEVQIVGVVRGGTWEHFGDIHGTFLILPDGSGNPPLDVLQRDLHLEIAPGAPFTETVAGIERFLTARHAENFAPATATYPAGDLSPVRSTLGQAAAGYRATAAVMLVIGALGLVNLMLVRVSRQRREIGMRRAVGATRPQVAREFLRQSVGLGLAGGVVGALLGVGTVLAVASASPWTPYLEAQWFILALAVAAIVAGLAGSYPAWQASRLLPAEALRARE